MKKVLTLLAGISAFVIPASAQAQMVQVNFGTTGAIPANNDFQAQLAGLGLTSFTTTGASLILSSNAQIFFEFLASESGFSDTFTAGPVTYTESSAFSNSFGAPIPLGFASFTAGNLVNLLTFTSSGGVTATVGQDGFGIFLGPRQVSGDSVSVFYLGYDDQINNQDDNHDDFIIRATVVPPVPEPTTWAMMLIGFAGVGYSMRRRRRATWMRQAA